METFRKISLFVPFTVCEYGVPTLDLDLQDSAWSPP